jgi:hypothetical protein
LPLAISGNMKVGTLYWLYRWKQEWLKCKLYLSFELKSKTIFQKNATNWFLFRN